MNLDDIAKDIEHYINPMPLGVRAIETISNEIYISNPIKSTNLIINLYQAAINKNDVPLQMAVLYKWLELSNFKDENALFGLHNTVISNLLSYKATTELQAKIIDLWIEHQPIDRMIIITDLTYAYMHNKDNYLANLYRLRNNKAVIENIYLPTPDILLKLINKYISTDASEQNTNTKLKLNSSKSYISALIQNLNYIINRWDLDKLPCEDAIKLLALSNYIGLRTISKIGHHYMPKTYNKVLATAQALGVVENPDYWVQNLPSVKAQLNTLDPAIEMPEFN